MYGYAARNGIGDRRFAVLEAADPLDMASAGVASFACAIFVFGGKLGLVYLDTIGMRAFAVDDP